MADITTVVNGLTKTELMMEPVVSGAVPDPVLTAVKIKAVVAKLREVEKWNGFWGVATSEQVPYHMVLQIEAARQAKIASLVVKEVTP